MGRPRFCVSPAVAPGTYLEADFDNGGALRLVPTLTTYAEHRVRTVASMTLDWSVRAPLSSGVLSPRGSAENRRKAVELLVGDLDENCVFQLVCSELDNVAVTLPDADASEAVGGMMRVAAKEDTQEDERAFWFVDAGDGYISVVPTALPTASLEVSENQTVVVAEGSASAAQIFELHVLDQFERTFALFPKGNAGVVEAQINDADRGRPLTVVPESEMSNFSVFKLLEIADAAPTPDAAAAAARRRKRDRLPERVAMLRSLLGDAFVPEAGTDAFAAYEADPEQWSVSPVVELQPVVAPELRVGDAAPSEIVPRALRAKRQRFVLRYAGRGYISIYASDSAASIARLVQELAREADESATLQMAALTVDGSGTVGFFAAERDAAEQRFEVEVIEMDEETARLNAVDTARAARGDGDDDLRASASVANLAAGQTNTKSFTLRSEALRKQVIEAKLDADGTPDDPRVLQLVPVSEQTNYCQFVLRDHEALRATDDKMEARRKALRARRNAAQQALRTDDLDALDEWLLVPQDDATARVQADGVGEGGQPGRVQVARRDASGLSQRFMFVQAQAYYFNIVPVADLKSALAVSESGAELVQVAHEPEDAEDPLRRFEFVAFESGFGLRPASRPEAIVEAALDRPEGERPLLLAADLTSFSCFNLVRPDDDGSPTPEAKKPGRDYEAEMRLADVVRVFGDSWKDRRVKLVSVENAERALGVVATAADVDGDEARVGTIAGFPVDKALTIVIRDAGQGYIALEAEAAADAPAYLSFGTADDDEGGEASFRLRRAGGSRSAADVAAAARCELLLLDGHDGFCLQPVARPDQVLELQLDGADPQRVALISADDITTFCALSPVDP